MSRVAAFIDKLTDFGSHSALSNENTLFTYHWLHEQAEVHGKTLKGIQSGDVVGLVSDYSPVAIGVFLALMKKGCIISVVNPKDAEIKQLKVIGEYDWLIRFNSTINIERCERTAPHHDLIHHLQKEGHAGLILFSSGTEGQRKAVVHDFERLLMKYERPKTPLTTLGFLFFDHIAGIDNLFYTLFNGGLFVITHDRNPDAVCKIIQDCKIELLSVSPTFIRLMLISKAYEQYECTSLKILTFGSEIMPKSALSELENAFPNTKIIQKFGMTEIGSPRTKTSSHDKLWFSLKDDYVAYRIVDGILWVRSEMTMLGYLNHDNPFDEEGWFCTGDVVEEDGDYIRILGRTSRIINVGGEKVHPIEVETVIMEMPEVLDATVYGETNPLLGQIVVARVVLATGTDEKTIKKMVQKYCESRLSMYKIPLKVFISDEIKVSDRMKKI